MTNLSNEVQQEIADKTNNAIKELLSELDQKKEDIYLSSPDPAMETQNPDTIAPTWVQDLKPRANNIMRKHTIIGTLTDVQYDINPNQHALEKYSVILNNNEPATIFVAYARQTALDPQLYITIHVNTQE